MKNLVLPVVVLISSGTLAQAATTFGPQSTVVKAGNRYIDENADLGGKMLPDTCKTENLKDGSFTLTCDGEYHIFGPGGGADFKIEFSCKADFKLKNAKARQLVEAYEFSKVDCEDKQD